MKRIAIDSEVTGLDIYHGARPFLVTTCDEDGVREHWEWNVDPLTRAVEVPDGDAEEIRAVLAAADHVELQNCKFDIAVLREAGIVTHWPWDKTHDTLIRGHVLASNLPHNLTDMVLQYLGEDILPWEERLRAACNEARRFVRKRFPDWRIAEKGLPEMPSAKGSSKKEEKGGESESPAMFDMWLPRAVAQALDWPQPSPDCQHAWNGWKCSACGGHRWWIVCSEYANVDSTVTLPLGKAQDVELEARGLVPLYREKMRNLRGLVEMERRGTTVRRAERAAMRDEYARESEACAAACQAVAAEHVVETCVECGHLRGRWRNVKLGDGSKEWTNRDCDCGAGWEEKPYELTLPKAGNNGSLTTFVFDVMRLPVRKRTEGGAPSLDKDVIEEYKKTLDGAPLRFVKDLSAMRKRAKSCEYLDAYGVFGVAGPGDFLVLHPSVNPTGAQSTTRFSMDRPNLQQVSKQETQCEACLGEGCDECGGTGEDLHSVRRVFGPGPGREWYSADAKNIELRIPAYESGERDLIALFEHPDDPPFYGSQHMLNMSIVYDDLWAEEMRAVGFEKVGPHCKKKYSGSGQPYHCSKCGGLGMQYQCGKETADRAFRRPGYDKLKAHFKRLDAHNARCVAHAEKFGYVETIPDRSLGMTRGYPLLCARGPKGRIIPTTPLNYRTQGTAGWWMVRAMNRCWDQLQAWHREDGFDGYMVLTVHDELVFDFPQAGVDPKTRRPRNAWRMEVLRCLMEQGGEDISVPTPVSVEFHPVHWGEGITLEKSKAA